MLTKENLEIIKDIRKKDNQLSQVYLELHKSKTPYIKIISEEESTIKRLAELLEVESYTGASIHYIYIEFVSVRNAQTVLDIITNELESYPTLEVIKVVYNN